MVGPPLYAGILSAGTGAHYLWNVGTFDELVQKWNELNTSDLRLTGVSSGQNSETDHWFIGVWNDRGGVSSLWRTTDWAFFMSKFEAGQSQSRLLDFDIKPFGSQLYFMGTWGDTPVAQEFVHDRGWDDFVAEWKRLSNQGMRLVKIQAFAHSGDDYHLTGLFEAGSGNYAFYVYTDMRKFLQQYNDLGNSMQLVDFEIFVAQSGTTYYIGVWRETSGKHYFLTELDWDRFLDTLDYMNLDGFRLQKAIRYSS
ncbi:hypothetical protein LTR41_011675 [Exophiala xenobiotica]|nr:hypothetical protein LTR41_011675 [Exophiala xenobiotica]KAK5243269.1 hypothetical protein LTS06_010931 [Exophiala xenobiotica]